MHPPPRSPRTNVSKISRLCGATSSLEQIFSTSSMSKVEKNVEGTFIKCEQVKDQRKADDVL